MARDGIGSDELDVAGNVSDTVRDVLPVVNYIAGIMSK